MALSGFQMETAAGRAHRRVLPREQAPDPHAWRIPATHPGFQLRVADRNPVCCSPVQPRNRKTFTLDGLLLTSGEVSWPASVSQC